MVLNTLPNNKKSTQIYNSKSVENRRPIATNLQHSDMSRYCAACCMSCCSSPHYRHYYWRKCIHILYFSIAYCSAWELFVMGLLSCICMSPSQRFVGDCNSLQEYCIVLWLSSSSVLFQALGPYTHKTYKNTQQNTQKKHTNHANTDKTQGKQYR